MRDADPLFLCIGDVDVDVLIKVDRLPTSDGKVNGALAQRTPGGMAGNVAAALARLGARARVLARVGDDAEADYVMSRLEAEGVDASRVIRMTATATFSCVSLLTPDGEKSLIKLMTPAYRPSAEDLSPSACDGVSHIHLTSIGDLALCKRVGERRTQGVGASIDIERSDCPDGARELEARLSQFDIAFCNWEARGHVDAVLGRPLSQIVPVAVTTLGAEGARIEAAELVRQVPGRPVSVLDTTGAGDCFAAAFLFARLRRRADWAAALEFANVAAALSVSKLGAQAASPAEAEVLGALRTGA